jgi:O-6-methylguanine DNA methyltransferase
VENAAKIAVEIPSLRRFDLPRSGRWCYGGDVAEILYTADFESAIGTLRVASSDRGLAYVELPRANGRGLMGWHQSYGEGARLEPGYDPNRSCIAQLTDFLEGKRRDFDLPLDLRGTPFQKGVYEELLRIAYGETRSYAQVAAAVGRPKAVRAVGAAAGSNPLPIVIPCHRVIGAGGKLQGYAGGLQTKAKLLAMERSGPGDGQLF